MSVQNLTNFLCEIFAVSHIGKVCNIEDLFNKQESCLNYNKLYNHPRTRNVLLFVSLFKYIFGFIPSSVFVEEILDAFPVWDTNQIANRLQSETFIKYAKEGTPLAKVFDKSRHHVAEALMVFDGRQSSTSAIKNLIWEWLTRGGHADTHLTTPTETLYSAYLKYICPSRSYSSVPQSYNFSAVTGDLLEWEHDFTQFNIVTYTEYDLTCYHVIKNMNYFRTVFGRVLVVIDTDVESEHALRMVDAIASSNASSSRIVVATHTPDTLARSKHNFSFISPCFIPHNMSALSYLVTSSSNTHLKLGVTPIRTIYIPSPNNLPLPECSKDYIIAIPSTFKSQKDIADVVKEHITKCIPLYAPQEILEAYFAQVTNIDMHSDMNVNRVVTYQSILPCIPIVQNNDSSINPTAEKSIVLVDTRANPLSLLSIYVALSNVQHKAWALTILTSSASVEYYRRHFPSAHYHTDLEILNRTPFDIESCNELMKADHFWSTLADFKKIMIIQDDGILARPGIEETQFMNSYTYSGAPWLPCPANKEVTLLTNAKMVGNGGFCIRDVGEMRAILKNNSREANVLFNSKLQPIQEDVYFAHFATNVPPTIQEASFFSMEQVFNINAYGFHKPWMYHPRERILELAMSILTR